MEGHACAFHLSIAIIRGKWCGIILQHPISPKLECETLPSGVQVTHRIIEPLNRDRADVGEHGGHYVQKTIRQAESVMATAVSMYRLMCDRAGKASRPPPGRTNAP
jgi:hypothetical protein